MLAAPLPTVEINPPATNYSPQVIRWIGRSTRWAMRFARRRFSASAPGCSGYLLTRVRGATINGFRHAWTGLQAGLTPPEVRGVKSSVYSSSSADGITVGSQPPPSALYKSTSANSCACRATLTAIWASNNWRWASSTSR